MRGALPLASFKLRFFDEHVRIVPLLDAHGCPFAGPGVDLRGETARDAVTNAQAIVAWFLARETVVMRTLSVDFVARRVLATFESGAGERPRVLRLGGRGDPGGAEEILALAAPLAAHLGVVAAARIAQREVSSGST